VTNAVSFGRLLTGLDTVEVAYFLCPTAGSCFSFERLLAEKERLAAAKSRLGAPLIIGSQEFLLRPHGTGSGYPLLLENKEFSIQCGEFNNPSFFVTYSSEALWRLGAERLHQLFLSWAASVGLRSVQPERLSRVDFAFDYSLKNPAFNSDCIVSLSAKDDMHRKDRAIQTLSFGKGDVRLRIYDKIAEIIEKSGKVWFFELWGVQQDVWRIEWQVRKALLRRFGIRTFEDLFSCQGDLLRYLATEHDTLRTPTGDSNRSRWPLHPLWLDLVEQIKSFQGQGIYREVNPDLELNERMRLIAVSVYGYLKRVGAISSIQSQQESASLTEAQRKLLAHIRDIHDPVTWPADVKRRRDSMRLGDI